VPAILVTIRTTRPERADFAKGYSLMVRVNSSKSKALGDSIKRGTRGRLHFGLGRSKFGRSPARGATFIESLNSFLHTHWDHERAMENAKCKMLNVQCPMKIPLKPVVLDKRFIEH